MIQRVLLPSKSDNIHHDLTYIGWELLHILSLQNVDTNECDFADQKLLLLDPKKNVEIVATFSHQ